MLLSLQLASGDMDRSFSRLRLVTDDLREVASIVDQLSPDERKYFGMPADQEAPMQLIPPVVRQSAATRDEQADKRRQIRERVDALVVEQEAQRKAERDRRRAENDRLIAEMKLRRLKEKAERQVKAEARQLDDEPFELHLKQMDPKRFAPVIGRANADGDTPVQLDPKTTILVKAGKNIHAAINRYQKILNLTITQWE